MFKKILILLFLPLLLLSACKKSERENGESDSFSLSDSSPVNSPDYMKNPDNIDPLAALKLREDYRAYLLDTHGESCKDEFKLESIWVQQYFGNYSGCEAVYMRCSLPYSEGMRPVEIAGYIITFNSGQEVYACKDSRFYTIKEAYEAGFITQNDVYGIGKQLSESFTEQYPGI